MENFHTPDGARRTVLISGASVAGPALAYWLNRYGFTVTIVERAGAVRSGGYPIDIRGTAIEVAERMGILPELRKAHINSQKLTFLNGDGTTIAVTRPEVVTGGASGRDVEVPRGVLTNLLYDLTRTGSISYRFGESITALDDDGQGVDVTFESGLRERFDIVIGADGMHSSTRALVFGREEPFSRYLGYCFNLFSMPNDDKLAHEAVICSTPGRMAGMFAAGDSSIVHGFLNFAVEKPPFLEHRDIDAQRSLTADVFADCGWRVPHMLKAMQVSDDLFFDTISQIRMPHWSSGRVALVGDAAYAPSFLSGQGTSLALVGAFVLAGELAIHTDPAAAFKAYERIARPFMEANQTLADGGGAMLIPRTNEELEARNLALVAAQNQEADAPEEDIANLVHNSLELPDYDRALVSGERR